VACWNARQPNGLHTFLKFKIVYLALAGLLPRRAGLFDRDASFTGLLDLPGLLALAGLLALPGLLVLEEGLLVRGGDLALAGLLALPGLLVRAGDLALAGLLALAGDLALLGLLDFLGVSSAEDSDSISATSFLTFFFLSKTTGTISPSGLNQVGGLVALDDLPSLEAGLAVMCCCCFLEGVLRLVSSLLETLLVGVDLAFSTFSLSSATGSAFTGEGAETRVLLSRSGLETFCIGGTS